MQNRYIPPEDFDRIIRRVRSDYRPLYILAAETGFRIDDILKLRQFHAKQDVLTLKEEKTGTTLHLADRHQLQVPTGYKTHVLYNGTRRGTAHTIARPIGYKTGLLYNWFWSISGTPRAPSTHGVRFFVLFSRCVFFGSGGLSCFASVHSIGAHSARNLVAIQLLPLQRKIALQSV